MGKLIELNSFFGQTLARQQADFSRVFFGHPDCLMLFRSDGNRAADMTGKAHVWSDGALLSDEDQKLAARRQHFKRLGTFVVFGLLLAALVAQIAALSVG